MIASQRSIHATAPALMLFAAVGVIVLPAARAAAVEGAVPVRELFQTETVYPEAQGELELNLFAKFYNGDLLNKTVAAVEVEYGVTDRFQIELEWDAFVNLDPDNEILEDLIDDTSGTGDVSVGLKYAFLNIAGSDFHAAIGVEVLLPTGDEDRGLGKGEVEFEPYLVLAKDFPALNRLQVFGEVGGEIDDEDEDLFWNAGLFLPVGRFVLTTEYNWTEEEEYVTPGILWHPGSDTSWELGLGAAFGLDDDSDDTRIFAIISHEFELSGRD